MKTKTMVLALALLVGSTAQADLIWYEGFDYTIGSALKDNGPWTSRSGGNVTIDAANMTAPGTHLAEPTGGRAFYDVADPLFSESMIQKVAVIPGGPIDEDTIYTSAILWHEQDGTRNKSGFHVYNLSTGNRELNRKSLVAGKWSGSNANSVFEVAINGGLGVPGRDSTTEGGYTGGVERLLVTRYTQNNTPDDPTDIVSGEVALDTTWWKFTNDNGTPDNKEDDFVDIYNEPITFESLVLLAKSDGNGTDTGMGDYAYDEIRMGTTFGDVTPIMSSLIGDFDRNGAVNGLDIPGFKDALADPNLWSATTGYDANKLGDFDGNGVFNGLDIPGFKDALAGAAVPEPATMLLVLGGALCAIRRRK
jgi:hypothetical protein